MRAYLGSTGEYELRLLCLNQEADPAVRAVDLTVYDEARAGQFAGVDTVLPAAVDPSPRAGRLRIEERNLDLLLNVMAAAQLR